MRQYDSCRAYLESYKELVAEARRLRSTIFSLWDNLTGTTGNYSGMPGGGSEYSDGALAALADARQRAAGKLEDVLREKKEMEEFIDSVPGEVNRVVLRLRYIEMLDWPHVAYQMDRAGIPYSQRQLLRIHGQALQAARVVWAERNKEEK